MPRVRHTLKQMLARLGRPALVEVTARVGNLDAAMAAHASDTADRLARIEASLGALAGATLAQEKYREELGFWRWLITTEAGRRSLPAPFEVVFGQWQRDRLRELARWLDLGEDDALDAALDRWCEARSAIEIGAGPYPCLAAAPRWRRAVAVDPIARGYAEEGLIPASAGHVVYVEAAGERLPLPSGSADLVVVENALDHVTNPAAVLAEARRVLRSDGLLWLLVDLSTHTDHMHPHAFDERSIRGLLASCGFESVRDRVSDHKSHPKAFGEYRGLLRPKPLPPPPIASRAVSAGSGR
ncbi:MAG: class I SAM-dependent methyltransferase [Phycisphaerae bacterium]|nr:class I SAM-dependent methyltransferase [Phycisphaerae bacterium]